ncbi:MAG TPA: integrase [Lachnospiraceae bacterium]|nr:integrase [Lachnospiraceae bacterium]
MGGDVFMNKRCVAYSDEEYEHVVSLLRCGFVLDGRHVRPNNRIATIVVLEATLGLRLCDILDLRMTSFIKDGDRYRLDIVEKKTKKLRAFTVPLDVYSYIQGYAIENNIDPSAKLFDISERQVQRHLNLAIQKMGLPVKSYGSHSSRKLFATKIYVDSNYNIALVQKLLQHSSPNVTQRYIGIQQKDIEEALERTKSHLV